MKRRMGIPSFPQEHTNGRNARRPGDIIFEPNPIILGRTIFGLACQDGILKYHVREHDKRGVDEPFTLPLNIREEKKKYLLQLKEQAEITLRSGFL